MKFGFLNGFWEISFAILPLFALFSSMYYVYKDSQHKKPPFFPDFLQKNNQFTFFHGFVCASPNYFVKRPPQNPMEKLKIRIF